MPGPEPPPTAPPAGEVRKSRKFSRLSCLRRRRHPPKAGDDSDLSEGFESDSSHDSARASEGSDSGSDKSLEGGGTAFDAETDSEMNSQESRSDLEDMEDEEGTRSPVPEPARPRSEAPESLNGPLGPSEASIASNLQAMSTQMFQTKRCFRLAPTFSNLLLQPPAEAHAMASCRPCVNGDADKPSEPGIWASVPATLVRTSRHPPREAACLSVQVPPTPCCIRVLPPVRSGPAVSSSESPLLLAVCPFSHMATAPGPCPTRDLSLGGLPCTGRPVPALCWAPGWPVVGCFVELAQQPCAGRVLLPFLSAAHCP